MENMKKYLQKLKKKPGGIIPGMLKGIFGINGLAKGFIEFPFIFGFPNTIY